MGVELNRRLHGGDWRTYQASSVRATLNAAGMKSWVAESDVRVVGFVAAIVRDRDRKIASPLATYARRTVDQDAQFFQRLIELEEIGGLV